jgi:uncharacterized protein (TIGR04255 family)
VKRCRLRPIDFAGYEIQPSGRHRATSDRRISLAGCKVECKVHWMKSALPKLTKAPVVSIIGQVRFSPVLTIESCVPKIQEELRQKGFPKFDKVTQQSLTFRPDSGPIPPTVEYLWRFTDREDCQIVILSTNAVTLHSTLNQTAEEFDHALLSLVTIVHKTVGPDLILRIGLRYLNVIQPSDASGLSDYVQDGLLGIPLEEAGARTSAWHVYSVNQTEHGVLVFQARHPISENFVPPDLSLGPNIRMRPLQSCPSLVLDLDHFVELNMPFDIEPIETTLKNFHSVIDRAFTLAVKKSALAEWR